MTATFHDPRMIDDRVATHVHFRWRIRPTNLIFHEPKRNESHLTKRWQPIESGMPKIITVMMIRCVSIAQLSFSFSTRKRLTMPGHGSISFFKSTYLIIGLIYRNWLVVGEIFAITCEVLLMLCSFHGSSKQKLWAGPRKKILMFDFHFEWILRPAGAARGRASTRSARSLEERERLYSSPRCLYGEHQTERIQNIK